MKELRDVYCSTAIVKRVSAEIATAAPNIDSVSFYRAVTKNYAQLSIMRRIARLADTFAGHHRDDYRAGVATLYRLAETIKPHFVYMFMPHYVGRYGHNHFDLSLQALGDFTPLSTSEMGIRPFLETAFDACYPWLEKWANDDNEHRRRLVSEGTRPRLPWATRLSAIEANPSLCWPLLEKLKEDEALYVRKSVANHLNDISRGSPDWLLPRLKKWNRENSHTAWIVKRGLRTLIKKDHRGALKLVGFEGGGVTLKQLRLSPSRVRIGESFTFSFLLRAATAGRIALHYRMHFRKKSGVLTAKVFKIAEIELAAGEERRFGKKHLFAQLSTRKLYQGKHHLDIVANGVTVGERQFILVEE